MDSQYSTGMSRLNIEQALVASGKDLSEIQTEDLSAVEDFHTLGRIATSQLAELAEINKHDECSMPAVASAAQHVSSPTGTAVESPPLTSPRSTAKPLAG